MSAHTRLLSYLNGDIALTSMLINNVAHTHTLTEAFMQFTTINHFI